MIMSSMMYGRHQHAEYTDQLSCMQRFERAHPFDADVGSPLVPAHYGDLYGYAPCSSPVLQHASGDLAWEANAVKMTGIASQESSATPTSLCTQALQIAALESLTNALNYPQQIPDTVQHPKYDSSYSQNGQSLHIADALLPFLSAPTRMANLAYANRPLHAVGSDGLFRRAATKQISGDIDVRAPHWANANWHPKAGIKTSSQNSTSKGTGVFLPCTYDQPEPMPKSLSRSHSDVSDASKEGASSSSDLSRLDSYQSSEVACSYIPAHGSGLANKLPAGDARRVVGSKIGAMPGKRTR